MKLDCFVILPSNNDAGFVTLVPDDRWGLTELPSGVDGEPAGAIKLNFDHVYNLIIKKGVADAQIKLAAMYREGRGVPQDFLRSVVV